MSQSRNLSFPRSVLHNRWWSLHWESCFGRRRNVGGKIKCQTSLKIGRGRTWSGLRKSSPNHLKWKNNSRRVAKPISKESELTFVVRQDKHLPDTQRSSCEIENDIPNAPAMSTFTSVIQVRLWHIFDQSYEQLHIRAVIEKIERHHHICQRKDQRNGQK